MKDHNDNKNESWFCNPLKQPENFLLVIFSPIGSHRQQTLEYQNQFSKDDAISL